IAFAHPDLGIGGAERLVVDAAVGLQSRGHKVVMYTSHHDPKHCFEETRDGTLEVRVRGDWLPRSIAGKGYIVFAIMRSLVLALAMLFEGERFDTIFSDQLSASIPILRWTGAKILFYCHFPDKLLSQRGSWLKSAYRMPIDILEELTTRMADEIVVNSKFTASVFRDSFPRISRSPGVLYPAIRFDAYDHKVNLANPTVKPLITDRKVLLSINRFERKKNIGLAIRAFAALRDKVPDEFTGMRLVIAGGYDTRVAENVEHHKELEALGISLSLTPFTIFSDTATHPPSTANLLFLPSFTEDQRTYLLSTSLCLLYTPSNEHFGIVPVEAMYARLPVVAVDSGGPRETVAEGVTGRLVEPEPHAFADAVVGILGAGKIGREEMGRKGRERVVERFS
ncbi:alpha-1,3-mannosyltransferase ALG2-like protein, partial [Blyttiomyces helicus]